MTCVIPTREMFRQHASLAPKQEETRHWLLDHPVGRDFLLLAARRYAPQARLPMFGRHPNDDVVFGQMIDLLGLRALAAPQDWRQDVRLRRHLLWEMMKMPFGQSSYVPIEGRRSADDRLD